MKRDVDRLKERIQVLEGELITKNQEILDIKLLNHSED
jgi:hypothetical protein